MASPHTDRPPFTRPIPAWIRYTVADRPIWTVCTVVPMVPIGLPALVAVVLAAFSKDWAAALLFLAMPGLILGTAMLFFPLSFCEQGIEVDAHGLRLRKKRKWWYRGRSLHVPWSVVRGLTVIREHPGRSDRQLLVSGSPRTRANALPSTG
jgi:hypothetical protein